MIKRLIIFVIFVVISVISFEVYLNLSHYETEVLLQYQPEFGWSHLANNNFWYMGNLFSINQDGFRDINHSVEKPGDIIRLAFVGSHYLRGTNSAFENIATTILEKEWNKSHPDKKIEVFNFAVPNYNLEMAYFLIKKYSQKYNVDYFFYVFDPQKDAPIVAGNSDEINNGPFFIFDPPGEIIKENLDFAKQPFDSANYKASKIYQFFRDKYYWLKNNLGKTKEQNVESEYDSNFFKPYPEIYFDDISPETSLIIRRMAKIMDYMVENSNPRVYILMIPPQHTQFFKVYESDGNLNVFYNNEKFVEFVQKIHNQTINEFLSGIDFFVSQVKNNHFDPNNLMVRLKVDMKNPERILEINELFLKFLDRPAADNFLHNWHRRDAGQAYLAEILKDNILPKLLVKDGN